MSGSDTRDAWIGPDADMVTPPPAFAAPQAVWLVNGNGQMPASISRCATALNMACRTGTISEVAPHGAGYAVIWCRWFDAPSPDDLAAFDALISGSAAALVVETDAAGIDLLWSRYGDDDMVTLLVSPDANECYAAMSRTRRGAGAAMHDTVDDVRQVQLDKLQEEVSRIARMLSRLDQADTRLLIRSPDGSREPASPFIEDHQLRSPGRGYTAQGGAAGGAAGGASVAPPVSARDVRRMVRLRRTRDQFFAPDLFADPAWDMLLDLYAARLERGRVSVSSLCIAAAVPATTALRWIKSLTTAGLFERREDPHDGRRIFVALSDDATDAMHRYFTNVVAEGLVV
jgi:hypothetical protein